MFSIFNRRLFARSTSIERSSALARLASAGGSRLALAPRLRRVAAVGAVVVGSALIGSIASASRYAVPVNVSCDDIAGTTQNPSAAGRHILFGAISVPPEVVSDKGTVRVGGAWPYWAKAGIFVRKGTFTVTVSVAAPWRSRAGITWGNSQRIVSALRFSGCQQSILAGDWSGYAGGFYLRVASACVPLVFTVGQRQRTVRFGVGRPCATKRPRGRANIPADSR